MIALPYFCILDIMVFKFSLLYCIGRLLLNLNNKFVFYILTHVKGPLQSHCLVCPLWAAVETYCSMEEDLLPL